MDEYRSVGFLYCLSLLLFFSVEELTDKQNNSGNNHEEENRECKLAVGCRGLILYNAVSINCTANQEQAAENCQCGNNDPVKYRQFLDFEHLHKNRNVEHIQCDDDQFTGIKAEDTKPVRAEVGTVVIE